MSDNIDSAMIAGQKEMIARMKDAVLPPDTGTNVGGLKVPVVIEEQRKSLEK